MKKAPTTSIEEAINAAPTTSIEEAINAMRTSQMYLAAFIKERSAAQLSTGAVSSICVDLLRLERKLSAYVKASH